MVVQQGKFTRETCFGEPLWTFLWFGQMHWTSDGATILRRVTEKQNYGLAYQQLDGSQADPLSEGFEAGSRDPVFDGHHHIHVIFN